MSNFDYIKDEFPEIYELAVDTERYVFKDGRASAFYLRMTLEASVKWLFANDPTLDQPYQPKGLGPYVYEESFKYLVPRDIQDGIHLAMRIGNETAHQGRKPRQYELITGLKAVFTFIKWVAHFYGRNSRKNVSFDEALIPKDEDVITLTKQQAEDLKDHMRSQVEVKLKEAREKDKEEIEALRAQLDALKAENDKVAFEPDFDPNEDETRKLYIDLLLNEVGWTLEGANDREYKVKGMPTESGIGYADYVLWGDDGKPLAVVEAKKSLRDAKEGKQQAMLYADCLEKMHGQRPVIFYTNGFETYIWDDKAYPARQVYGFYTKRELETLIERRHNKAHIDTMAVDPDIAGRDYQVRAIKKVQQAFANKQRKALLVMATGSGKTRTAVALVKTLTQANWAKRILFLADRTSLVTQAMKKNFKPHLPHLSMVNLLEDKESEESRMVFSTYQTMMNMIDLKNEDGTRSYGVGHFDLIIVDESHRSIYKKYGALFDYFDSHLLGLTATPKSDIDKNTFAVFELPDGHPTDVYSLKEAIEEEKLVDFKIRKPELKFPAEGIRYEELTEEEKEEYEATFTDEVTGEMPEAIGGAAVNSWLFNKDTVHKVIDILMEDGLRVAGGDRLGKTIVFCRNRPHAEFFVEEFDKKYPKYAGHFCQAIHNKVKNAQKMIDDFSEKEGNPVIAVSVDMMDTGIDVPEVLNLVFFKPVKSKAKFWQMIGRGTRLCEDVFGPGQDKDHFRIFDFCKNFDFFAVNGDGFESGMGETLSQKVFKARVRLAHYLQHGDYQQVEATRELWQESVDWVHEQIDSLETDSALVRKSRRSIERFKNKDELVVLDEGKVGELIKDISHLPLPQVREEEMKKRFDVQMLHLMLAIIEKTPRKNKIIKDLKKTAEDLLEKASLPSVQKKLPLLQRILEKEFWDGMTVDGVERIRVELRDLIKLLEKDDKSQQIYYTNLEDEHLNPDEVWEDADDYGDEFVDYKESLRRYFLEHPELESVWKLMNNVPLTADDLNELETVVYSSEVSDKEKFEENCDGHNIKAFVRSLTGMNREAVSQAFGEFINNGSFNVAQIDCLNIIIEHYVKYGFMEKSKLAQQPFKDYGGVMNVFGKDLAIKIVGVIDEMNDQVG